MTIHTVPSHVGSPAMPVIAAIPLGHGNEYICTIAQVNRPGHFGTVHAYRGENASGEVKWHASAGNYDLGSVQNAIRDMITRSGIQLQSLSHNAR